MEGQEIGEGTFGQVTVENGKAVKLIKAGDIEERFDTADESFITEISSYLRLAGKPNIVTMDSYSVNPYIIRTTLYKESLNVYLRNKKSYLNKSKIAYDILVALHNQFTMGILHGDIKPANIFLTNRGAVMGDYGIAQYTSVAPVPMEPIVYTIYQRPPECLALKNIIDFAADMWAYGILLLEIFINDDKFPGILKDEELSEWHKSIAVDSRPPSNNKYLSLKDMVNKGMITSAEYNLVSRLLYLNPRRRASPVELSTDPYFAGFRPINFVPYHPAVAPSDIPIVNTYSQAITNNMYSLDRTLRKVISTDVKSVQLLKEIFKNMVYERFPIMVNDNALVVDTVVSFGYLMQFVDAKDYELLFYIISRVHRFGRSYYNAFDQNINVTNIDIIMRAIGSGFSVFPLRILYHEVYKNTKYDARKSQHALLNYISNMKHVKKSLSEVIQECLVEKR